MLGKHHSEATKKILREKNKLHRHTTETKIIISQAGKGRKLTQETKDKIGKGNKGHIMSEEQKIYLRELYVGKPLNKIHKENISKSLIGNKYCLGKNANNETKNKMSESQKKRWAIRKNKSND